MVHVIVKEEFVWIQANAKVLGVQLILIIVQMIKAMLNVAKIYLVNQMMEEMELAHFLPNVMEKV